MFDRKRTSLYEVTPKVTKGSGVQAPKFENIFQREAYKMEHQTTSGNGSLKYDTSGNVFVDDFAAIGNYRKPREFAEVSQTMERLWDQETAGSNPAIQTYHCVLILVVN